MGRVHAGQRGSGRVLLRLPPSLHEALARAAEALGLSLNEYCVRRLSAPAPRLAASADSVTVVTRAAAAFGRQLVAVLVHGSFARGTPAATSDVDVLIVVDAAAPLTRSIYRTWDADPLVWDGRPVDVHVVHPPRAGEAPSALWCEAATDAMIVYERDDAVSARLGALRRAMAAGRLVRRLVHGQPYWVEAA